VAMNKKEQAAFAAAVRAARVAGALRRTSPVLPDLPPPATSRDLTQGWTYNSHSGAVSRACSSAVFHSAWTDKKTDSQGPRSLYSTKISALKALRYAMEQDFARRLADIDELIAAEEAAP
jgi:hypothetical protein